MQRLFISLFLVVVALLAVYNVSAAAPDGSGPWADSVVSSFQANTKGGTPVSVVNPARSNPTAALGVAEGDTTDSNFFSLGFGGSITLRFDNPISNGVLVVEATNPSYPEERANIELSADGSSWMSVGTATQDETFTMPEGLSCARYVRVTDTSNAADFSEDTADAYDVDGVQALEGEPCQTETPSPTPTQPQSEEKPATTPSPTPTNTPSTGDNGGGNNGGNTGGNAAQCSASKPPTPSLTSVNRTSGTTAQLTWSAVSPVTHYAISYGVQSGVYLYGVPNAGNVTTYTVGGLDPATTYYFAVRAVNDCTPGDLSGASATGQALGAATGGQVLGASTDVLAATGSEHTARRAMVALLIASGMYLVGAAVLSGRHEKG